MGRLLGQAPEDGGRVANKSNPAEAAMRLDASAGPVSACAHCGAMARCRRRTFSEQAWSLLLLWKEVDAVCVQQAICDDCYKDLRDVLIERDGEIEQTVCERGEELAEIRQQLGSLAV